MNITHEERVEFLNAHNDLKSMLMTVHEMNETYTTNYQLTFNKQKEI